MFRIQLFALVSISIALTIAAYAFSAPAEQVSTAVAMLLATGLVSAWLGLIFWDQAQHSVRQARVISASEYTTRELQRQGSQERRHRMQAYFG